MPQRIRLPVNGLFQNIQTRARIEQQLDKPHSDVRSHFEGPQFEEAEAQSKTLGSIQLVDAELGAMRVSCDIHQQIAEQSIHNKRRAVARRHVPKRKFQLVQCIHPRLVYARILACRTDIHAGKQVRQRRMILPERHHAAQQIGTAQKGAVHDSGPADHDVAAAAGSDMAAVVGEFFSGQPVFARFLKEHRVDSFEVVPIARGWKVYFQNSRVGSNAERPQPRIGRRSVALQPHRFVQVLAGIFDGREQVKIIRKLRRIR